MVTIVLSRLLAMVTPSASKFQVGVDVSSYQGPPTNWTSEAGKISWAAVKITELEQNGNRYVNPDAARDWDWLSRNDKGRIGYLFGHPSVSAAETVSFFASEIRKLGLRDKDGIALDHESTDDKSPAEVAAWAVKVQAELFHSLHRTPVLYTFLSFAEGGNCAGLGHYPLWIADPSRKAGHPHVPKPWKKWAVHQHVITGPIDRDVANFRTRTAMFNALGKPEEPQVHNIGGSIVGSLASARWPNGVNIVAGLGKDGFIQAARWNNGSWGSWKNVNTDKALGSPALEAFGDADGRLFYTDSSGSVVVLRTENGGETWS
jgi:lysozyme